jgi:hypothetical protein
MASDQHIDPPVVGSSEGPTNIDADKPADDDAVKPRVGDVENSVNHDVKFVLDFDMPLTEQITGASSLTRRQSPFKSDISISTSMSRRSSASRSKDRRFRLFYHTRPTLFPPMQSAKHSSPTTNNAGSRPHTAPGASTQRYSLSANTLTSHISISIPQVPFQRTTK